MKNRYDAVVIGAGLGGLSAATLLARRGFSTLLLEQHNIPGGYATSFVRGRYEFEVALHELSDIGSDSRPGVLGKYLKYLGVRDKVEFVQIPELYRSVFPDLDMTLPRGREAYVDTLCKAFPHEEKGIRRFMKRVFDLAREVDDFQKVQSGKIGDVISVAVSAPFKLRAIPRYLFSTWEEVMARDISDIKVRAVISQYWGYFGLPPSKISFFLFALALASYIAYGPAHIRGRSQALSNAFIERFEELGGEVCFNCGVSKINSNSGKVTGVVTDDGREYLADIVVSNASPIATCRDMLGVDNIPPAYFKKMRSNEVAASSFNVYLGLACSPEAIGATSHEVFVNENFNYDSHYALFDKVAAPYQMVVTTYNTIMPEISPPGTSMLVLTTLCSSKGWEALEPEKYVDAKNMVAGAMMEKAEKVLPGLRREVEVVEVATPLTNMRYARTTGGSIYGFSNTPFNHTVLRLPAMGPLKGLFFVGAWVQPGGGYSPAMLSGQMAGEFISRIYGKKKGRS